MNISKLISLLILGFPLALIPARGQDKAARMEKDIDVFEKVMNELFRKSVNGFPSSSTAHTSATYVPGYGVIVNLPPPQPFSFNFNFSDMNKDLHLMLKESRKNMQHSARDMQDAERAMIEAERASRQTERDVQEMEKEIIKVYGEPGSQGKENKEIRIEIEEDGRKSKGRKKGKEPHIEKETIIMKNGEVIHIKDGENHSLAPLPPIPPRPGFAPPVHAKSFNFNFNRNTAAAHDSMQQVSRREVSDLMKKALQNYGDLLSQLAPSEKILLVYDEGGSGHGGYTFYGDGGTESKATSPSKITAEVKKEDIDALQAGKIKPEDFNARVQLKTEDQKNQDILDYKIFSGILETVFNHSPESGFRVKGNIRYTSLQGFGVIYNARMRNVYSTSTDDEDDPKLREERAKKMKAEFSKLEQTLKNTMLDYGRSLRSLKDDQFILLNVQVSDAGNTSKTLRVKVKKEVLSKYEKELIAREKALEEVTVNFE